MGLACHLSSAFKLESEAYPGAFAQGLSKAECAACRDSSTSGSAFCFERVSFQQTPTESILWEQRNWACERLVKPTRVMAIAKF